MRLQSTHIAEFDQAIVTMERAQSDALDAGTTFVIAEVLRMSRRWPLRKVTMVACMGHLDIHVATKVQYRKGDPMWEDYSFDCQYRTIHDRKVEALSWLDKIEDFERIYDFLPVNDIRIECLNGVITKTDYVW
jgi:hypothetical protein